MNKTCILIISHILAAVVGAAIAFGLFACALTPTCVHKIGTPDTTPYSPMQQSIPQVSVTSNAQVIGHEIAPHSWLNSMQNPPTIHTADSTEDGTKANNHKHGTGEELARP